MDNKLIIMFIVIFMLSIGTVFATDNISDSDSKKITKSSEVISQKFENV